MGKVIKRLAAAALANELPGLAAHQRRRHLGWERHERRLPVVTRTPVSRVMRETTLATVWEGGTNL